MKWPKSEEKIEIVEGALEKLRDPPDGVPPIADVWLRHCS